MHQPLQNPPVERLYMREVVGHHGLPQPAKNGRGRGKASERPRSNYLVELTTFHVRPRRPGGR